MSFQEGNVGQFVVTWRDTTMAGTFRNVLRYRQWEGTATDTIIDNFMTNIIASWPLLSQMMGALPTTTWLAEVSFEKIFPNKEYKHVTTFGPLDQNGTDNAPARGSSPQAAACIIRRSFNPGRIGIGRTFIGPLGPGFLVDGIINPSSEDGGELAPAISGLNANVVWVAGNEAKPVVCNKSGSNATDLSAVRVCELSPEVSFLHSRKIGRGE